jgi:hypothetical protein
MVTRDSSQGTRGALEIADDRLREENCGWSDASVSCAAPSKQPAVTTTTCVDGSPAPNTRTTSCAS